MFANEDPAAFDGRIEALTQALAASSDVEARQSARELVGLVLEFHRVGLQKLLDIVAEAPIDVRQRMAGDPVIASLLALHELATPESAAAKDTLHAGGGTPLLQIRRRPDVPLAAIAFHGEAATRCERCGAPIGRSHHHYVDVVSRRLSCSCRACWLLSGAHGGPASLRAVPDRYLGGPAFRLSDAQWDALQVPVATAFFMFNTAIGRTIAFYPSPAGATESALSLAAWRDVEESNPWVRSAAPDVEAILVRRNLVDGARFDAFVVPVDACYDLVGRIRMHWSGFDGGEAVRAEIDRFFLEVAARSVGPAESIAGRS